MKTIVAAWIEQILEFPSKLEYMAYMESLKNGRPQKFKEVHYEQLESGVVRIQIRKQYKTGKYEPMQDALYKLATALNVNVAWLMGHDVPMEVDKVSLEQKVAACELLEKCYGSKAYELVELFVKLDDTDRAKLLGYANALLDADKYSVKKESSNARAIS